MFSITHMAYRIICLFVWFLLRDEIIATGCLTKIDRAYIFLASSPANLFALNSGHISMYIWLSRYNKILKIHDREFWISLQFQRILFFKDFSIFHWNCSDFDRISMSPGPLVFCIHIFILFFNQNFIFYFNQYFMQIFIQYFVNFIWLYATLFIAIS